MTTNSKLAETQQKLDPGQLVILYELDLTNIGGGKSYYVDAITTSGTIITYNGIIYNPIDIVATGFEVGGQGEPPRPTLKIANTTKTLEAEITAYDDLIGGILTRRRTYAKHLDNGSDPDYNAQYPPDIWVINRKLTQNKIYVEWELKAYLDYQGIYLPKRQIIRDSCRHTYRYYDTSTSSFVYDGVTCPYTGNNYYKADGTSTTDPAEDRCGKRLSDCKLRYPNKDDELPLWSFPGVSKIRVR